MKRSHFLSASALAAIACATPAMAQQTASEDAAEGRGDRRATIAPYIEASQVLVAEISPGDDVVTYSQVAAGIDASVTGRNNGGSISLRYERNFGYGDDALDSDTVSGVARGYATVVPRALTVEGGAMAARTRVDGNGARRSTRAWATTARAGSIRPMPGRTCTLAPATSK